MRVIEQRSVSYIIVVCFAIVLSSSASLAGGTGASFTAESVSAPSTGGSAVRVLFDSSADVQGFVISMSHDPAAITLSGVDIAGTDTELSGAEFVVPAVYADGGTIGVVLDFNAPYDGQVIPASAEIHAANYNYNCNSAVLYFEGDPVPPSETTALTFIDGLYGSPALFNVSVSGGLSVWPALNDGTFTCDPVAIPSEDTVLWMETEFDNSEGNAAFHGQTGSLCFYYADADDNIQGMTMTGCYDCDLTVGSDWDWNGSIVEEIGVEYLAVQIDDDASDGDGCELVVAFLLDALPPFEGQTMPQTANLNEGRLLIGCLSVTVDDTAECDVAQEINWCNGINGTGSVNLYNNVVIEFQSIQIYERNDTSVMVVPEEIFQRGDCNSDDETDLADAASILANQFGNYEILCSDACDTNDDGLLNMADSVFLLNWLFKFGISPAAPGPYSDGADPTGDSLPVCDSDDTNCG